MSVAINRAIIFKDRTSPTEVPTAGEIYFWLEGDSLKYKTSTSVVNTLSTGITAEQVQDIVGALMGNSASITFSYDDAGNVITASIIQSAVDHDQISNRGTNTHAAIDSHIGSNANPHSTTKAQVGLANVPNLDTSNPSNITQSATFRFVTDVEKAAWNAKESAIAAGTTAQYWRGDKTWQTHDKASVGLGNVDNTTDLLKPISTATQVALNAKYDATNPNGYETPTQLNARDTANRARGAHTGTQIAATISDFATTVLATVLTGLSTATNSAIIAADSVLVAFGKLQAQINGHFGQGGSVHALATTSVAGFMSAVDKSKLDGLISDILFFTTANLTQTSNVTFTQIPELNIPCTAGNKYRFKAHILFQTAAVNTGIGLSITGTAAGTLASNVDIPISNTGGTANKFCGPINAINGIVTSTGVGTANIPYVAEVEGFFKCTTSGNLTMQFRSEVNGSQVTVLAASTMVYKEF